jgi:hypothetical protein
MPFGRAAVCRSRRPKIGPALDRVIPYVHYRDRERHFTSFFNRLTLLQRETPAVTKSKIALKRSKETISTGNASGEAPNSRPRARAGLKSVRPLPIKAFADAQRI